MFEPGWYQCARRIDIPLYEGSQCLPRGVGRGSGWSSFFFIDDFSRNEDDHENRFALSVWILYTVVGKMHV